MQLIQILLRVMLTIVCVSIFLLALFTVYDEKPNNVNYIWGVFLLVGFPIFIFWWYSLKFLAKIGVHHLLKFVLYLILAPLMMFIALLSIDIMINENYSFFVRASGAIPIILVLAFSDAVFGPLDSWLEKIKEESLCEENNIIKNELKVRKLYESLKVIFNPILISTVSGVLTYVVTHTVFGFGTIEASLGSILTALVLGIMGYKA